MPSVSYVCYITKTLEYPAEAENLLFPILSIRKARPPKVQGLAKGVQLGSGKSRKQLLITLPCSSSLTLFRIYKLLTTDACCGFQILKQVLQVTDFRRSSFCPDVLCVSGSRHPAPSPLHSPPSLQPAVPAPTPTVAWGRMRNVPVLLRSA